jgi:hypothetical protein
MDQLKDVILSTLAEIQESVPQSEVSQPTSQNSETHQSKPKEEAPVKQPKKESFFEEVTAKQKVTQKSTISSLEHSHESEILFLNSLRERLLVLFEGFQAPNNTAIEAKIDLTLNFLEYLLSVIDERLENIKGKE